MSLSDTNCQKVFKDVDEKNVCVLRLIECNKMDVTLEMTIKCNREEFNLLILNGLLKRFPVDIKWHNIDVTEHCDKTKTGKIKDREYVIKVYKDKGTEEFLQKWNVESLKTLQ